VAMGSGKDTHPLLPLQALLYMCFNNYGGKKRKVHLLILRKQKEKEDIDG
jgi:hypothetical protein